MLIYIYIRCIHVEKFDGPSGFPQLPQDLPMTARVKRSTEPGAAPATARAGPETARAQDGRGENGGGRWHHSSCSVDLIESAFSWNLRRYWTAWMVFPYRITFWSLWKRSVFVEAREYFTSWSKSNDPINNPTVWAFSSQPFKKHRLFFFKKNPFYPIRVLCQVYQATQTNIPRFPAKGEVDRRWFSGYRKTRRRKRQDVHLSRKFWRSVTSFLRVSQANDAIFSSKK